MDGLGGGPHRSQSDHGDGDGEASHHGALRRPEGLNDERRDDEGGNQSAARSESQTLANMPLNTSYCIKLEIKIKIYFILHSSPQH